MARVRTSRIVFTINNHDLETPSKFIEFFETDKKIRYGVVGEEVGESGTLHLQGFIHYDVDPKKGGLKFWKELLPEGSRAHIEAAKGTDEDNQKYCSKEAGEPQGATSKWGIIFETAKTDLEAALKIDPEISNKYRNQLHAINRKYESFKLDRKLEKLRPWQEKVMHKLKNQDERTILFVVDEKGGKGKSRLTSHILSTENAWACQGGNARDLMHTYKRDAEFAIFDMARCNAQDYYPWNFMENIKNQWFNYNGCMTAIRAPKVVVFMNQMPAHGKLSDDRMDIMVLE